MQLHRSRIFSTLGIICLTGFAVMKTARSKATGPPNSQGIRVVANQFEHTTLLVDPDARKEIAKISVGINGHEVTVDKAGKFAYVPIYGNSGVGKPGTDGSTIDV